MKSHTLAALFFIYACLFSIKASAASMICTQRHGCLYSSGSCNWANAHGAWISQTLNSPTWTCFTLGALALKPENHILSTKDGVWIVEGAKRTQFASDRIADFLKKFEAKYSVARAEDHDARKRSLEEWDAFWKTPESGKVSPQRLQELVRETGLKVLASDKK